MKRTPARGFTLIELLTVIAVIAILASITLVAAPRLIERAKLRSLDGTMRELRTVLAEYYADHGTYPPRYGYIDFEADRIWREEGGPRPPDKFYFHLTPYLTKVKRFGNTDFHDNFSEGYDADRDGVISLFEYSPVGDEDQIRPTFANDVLYNGTNGGIELDRMLQKSRERRPIIYVPVNRRQFEKARTYWLQNGDWLARNWDPSDTRLQGIAFPPATYDTFVLISVGPGGSTFGIPPKAPTVSGDPDQQSTAQIMQNFPEEMYHILGLRAYFLATRDLNNNGQPDFHFEARTRGEAKIESTQVTVGGSTVVAQGFNRLPDPRAPLGYGPYIYSF